MKELKKQYRDLETRVFREIRQAVKKSTTESEYTASKAIKINFKSFDEIALVDDRLVFIDKAGLYYDLYADCNLEELIDLLNI